ncbi:hypothetical protein [Pedobacter jejuensis]|uniref:Uncharacterized protein n=1 Tax=Pedobacter jejuensis TaxID=1268550 RepID=A0A3N0C189_9SPHI|nr:hypothetical protein [Pedobacter jejuensis]RNL55796.1 hypothetical protein D7004_03300 [Pedobacter jejuensis]
MTKLITFLLIVISINAFGQTGCRRISDGVLFQNQILFSSDYNSFIPFNGDVSMFCLPPGNTGTSCNIRNPITQVTSPGRFGAYSAINCDIDDYTMVAVFISGVFGIKMLRRFILHKFTSFLI